MSEARTDSPGGVVASPFTIVCGYSDGMLPNPWFRAYKRVKRGMRRAAFNARVELLPITQLPSLVDLLVVPPSLEETARTLPGIEELLVAQADEMQAGLDRLVERLSDQGTLLHATAAGRSVAVHRGFQAVRERARLNE
jgi:hypothetical protein